MKVRVKKMSIDLEVKNNGIEFEVRDNDGTFRGDCFLTQTGLIWCEGKTTKQNGVKVSWNDFIEWMNED